MTPRCRWSQSARASARTPEPCDGRSAGLGSWVFGLMSLRENCPSTSATAKVGSHPRICHPEPERICGAPLRQATPQPLSLHPSQLRSGRAHCRSLGCPGFPVKVGGVANSMRFSLQKTAHAALSLAPRTGNPGTLGMTKGEGSVHLSRCYKGLRELYAEREANDPSIHITNCRGRNKSTFCHPDRSEA